MVRAYLVDFDGTLADTARANYLAYAAALREVDLEIGWEEFERTAHGLNWRQFLPVLLKSRGRDDCDPERVAARKVHHYRAAARHIEFNEALIDLLKSRAPHIRTALVTSASAANVQSALAARTDLRELFDAIVTGDDVTRHKPDPESFRRAAELLDVAPEHCLVFEDSGSGVAAGRAFGAKVIKVCIC